MPSERPKKAKLFVKDVQLFNIISVPRINQIYTFFTGLVANHDFGPTPESSEVKLFIDDIPWDDLAFRTVRMTIELYLKEGRVIFNNVLDN